MNLYQVLLKPIVTEKTEEIRQSLKGYQRYSFYVHPKANKELVRQAVRYFYKVKAVKVNIMNNAGKYKRFQRQKYRQSAYKKAIVTLSRGQSIELSTKEK